ncbi:MAG: hypothetical protein ACR2PS_13850 [Pseudomonadales bacterium]
MSSGSPTIARRPSYILRNVVRRLGRRDEWDYAAKRAPALVAFSTNLSRYLTESVPAVNANRPLLSSCIDRGLDGYLAAESTSQNERVKLYAFIRSVLYPLPEALEWSLSCEYDGVVELWNPMEQCVCDWWTGKGTSPEAKRRSRPDDSAYVELNPADFRLIVLVRFLARDPIQLTPLSARLDDLVTRYG